MGEEHERGAPEAPAGEIVSPAERSEAIVLDALPANDGPALTWRGKRAPAPLPREDAHLVEVHGRFDEGRGTIILGDNLRALAHLLPTWRGKVDLVYLDPPFQSGANYGKRIRLRGPDGPGPVAFEAHQYGDVWSTESYLQFMYERLIALRTLLSREGAIVVQCDWHQAGHLRCMLDEIFGADNFRNEIVWHYYNKIQGNVGRFAANHDTLLYYTKSGTGTFHKLQEPRDVPVRQIKRVWDKKTQSLVNAKKADGRIAYVDATHRTVDDVWRLSMLQPADKTEGLGYPTQKPESLLERIIGATTSPGDVVLDPFMGSGTTLAVAAKLGRRFIGLDANPSAVATTVRRLLELARDTVQTGTVPKIKNGLGLEWSNGQSSGAPPKIPGFDVWHLGPRHLGGQGGPPSAEAPIALARDGSALEIRTFSPPALLAKLHAAGHVPDDWRALVDLVLIDPAWDGTVLRPTIVDLPDDGGRVRGTYVLPDDVRAVRVKIVDLLGDTWEVS